MQCYRFNSLIFHVMLCCGKETEFGNLLYCIYFDIVMFHWVISIEIVTSIMY